MEQSAESQREGGGGCVGGLVGGNQPRTLYSWPIDTDEAMPIQGGEPLGGGVGGRLERVNGGWGGICNASNNKELLFKK